MADTIKIEVFSLTADQIANGVTLTSSYDIVDNTVIVNIQHMTSVLYGTDYFFDNVTKKVTFSAELQDDLTVGDNVSINYEEESTDGNAWNVTKYYTKKLDSIDIINKFIIVPDNFASNNIDFNIRHAPEQIKKYAGISGYDFDVNLTYNMITWNGMALDGQLVVGDEVTVIYPVLEPVGRRIREQHTVSGDIATSGEITLLCERIPDTSISVELRGAPSQALSADFDADLNTVRWATTTLSGHIQEGDEIAIIYHTQQGMGVNPYKIIIDYADSQGWGLAPDLQNNIRKYTKYTSKDRLPSALAIRKALDVIDTEIYQMNASTSAYNIYDENATTNVSVTGTGIIPADLEAIIGGKNVEKTYYRPIEVSGAYITLDETIDETLDIATVAIEDNFTDRLSGSQGNDRFSVQGGRYHYGALVTEADVNSNGKIIATAKPNDVIAKIFLRIFTKMHDRDAKYSIGTADEPERFVKQFSFKVPRVIETVSGDTTVYRDAPSGIFESWQYGIELINDEYVWLNSNDFPIYDATTVGASTAEIIDPTLPIYIFSDRDPSDDATLSPAQVRAQKATLSGQVGVAIFYDEANFDNIHGYLLGSSSDLVQKLNMYTDTIFVTQLGSNISNTKSYVAEWDGVNDIYSAGGSGLSAIQKYDIFTDTFENIPALMPVNLTGAVAGVSRENMYIFGGTSDAGLSGLASKITFSTDTLDYNYFVSEFDRIGAGSVSLQNKIYMFGGYEETSGTFISGKIDKYDTVTDTAELLETALLTNRLNAKGFAKNRGTILMVAGESLTGLVPSTERYNISTDTVSEVAGPLIPVSRGMVVQDKVNGYYCGGICNYEGEIAINIIQKCIMASNTWEIMNEQIRARKSEQDSSSTVPFDIFVSQ